jgi:hypothetical protein
MPDPRWLRLEALGHRRSTPEADVPKEPTLSWAQFDEPLVESQGYKKTGCVSTTGATGQDPQVPCGMDLEDSGNCHREPLG